jgi:hypothetical protein
MTGTNSQGRMSLFLVVDVVHEFEVKNQSKRSRRGGVCLFVQVNFLPKSGNSTTPKALIASLNNNISFMSPPGLFVFKTSHEIKDPKNQPINVIGHLNVL